MANLKDVIYISNEDYETLVSTGTVTIGGTTLTYDENNLYITPDKAYYLVTNSSIGTVKYLEDVSYTAASASGTATVLTGVKASGTSNAAPSGHTHSYDKTTVSGSNSTHTTKYMKFTAGTTPKSSASFSGTAATITPTLSAGTTKYLSASFSGTSATSGSNSGTNFSAVTGYPNFNGGSGSFSASRSTSGSGTAARRTLTFSHSHTAASLGTASTSIAAPGSHTHSVTATGSVTLTANDSTATGRITYLQSQGTITGASYTPAGSVTLTAGTAPSMNFNTGTSTDTPYISSMTDSTISYSTASATSGANSGTAVAAVTGVTSDGTASAVTGVNGGSLSKTTKYLSLDED